VRELEQQLEQTTAKLQDIEQTLADEKTYSEMPPDELTNLLADAGKTRQALEAIEEQWISAVDQLESADDMPE
jgi:ATP-binding cassette subfamily F protein 3